MPSVASSPLSRGTVGNAPANTTKSVGGVMILVAVVVLVVVQMTVSAGPPSGRLELHRRRRQVIVGDQLSRLDAEESDDDDAASSSSASPVGRPQSPPRTTRVRRRPLHPQHVALIEGTYEHPICDPSAADCVLQRPLQTFDAYKQSELAPEMLLVEKRRVSRLFVLPPPLPMAHPRNAERSVRAVVGFAMWLLTSIDAQGAVVLTARSPDQYEALCALLVEARREALDAGAWGNIFVSSVAFAPGLSSAPPSTTRPPSSLAPTDDEIEQQRDEELRRVVNRRRAKSTEAPAAQKEEEEEVPPMSLGHDATPALNWHLSGLDAAQERYTADSVVLFDSAPPPLAIYEEHMRRAAVAERDIGTPCNATASVQRAASAPAAVESSIPSDVLFVLLRRSAWRFWFVNGRVDPNATTEARWRLSADPNATELQPPLTTVNDLLVARRRASVSEGNDAGLFQPLKLATIVADPYRRCGRRRFEGALVQIGGTSEMVTVDNVLAALVRNPQWLVVVVVANSGDQFASWLEKLPHFFHANIRLYAGGAAEAPCRDFQEQHDIKEIQFSVAEHRTCLAVMAMRANESAVYQPWPSSSAGTTTTTTNAGGGPIVLLPIRDAVVFAGDLSEAFGTAMASVPPSPSFSPLSASPLPSPHAAVAVAFPTAARLLDVPFVADQAAAAQALGLAIAADCIEFTAQPSVSAAEPATANATAASESPRQGKVYPFAGLVADVRKFGPRSPSAQRSRRWAERDGSHWPSADVDKVLDDAERNGAVFVFPVGGKKGPLNAPWRYFVRRRRIDPKIVQAMHPMDKAKLWCNPETFEGCQPSIAQTIRKSRHCANRNHDDSQRRAITCDMKKDDRVRKQDWRPSPAATLRRPMPSVVGSNNTANLTAAQLRETPFERDVEAGAVNDTRLHIDVLISVITHGHGHADQVEQAESWLEYCPTCVLVYEEGPQEANLGETYDIMKRGLAPELFDRLIVNPKAGLNLPVSAPRLIRHLHNIKYARCFVAPLRVLMVAGNEAPFRPGLAEYMLSHAAVGMRDVRSLVAESDNEDDRCWQDVFMLSTAPRLTQAAQQFAYGSQWAAFSDWAPLGFYHCSGKTFFDQTRSGLSSVYGFEGTWFTGAQWLVVDRVFQHGYWTEPVGYIEHQYVQVPALEGELIRVYGSPPSMGGVRTPASPNPFFVAKSKPLGRNTCFLARLRQPYNIALGELKQAIADRSEQFQFSVKRVGPGRNDDGRRWLREERKRGLGIGEPATPRAEAKEAAETTSAAAETTAAPPPPRKSKRSRRRTLREET